MKIENSANTGIIASGSIITFLELIIQFLPDHISTGAATLAPILGGLIAWIGNRILLKVSLPDNLRSQDALLYQSIKLLKKDYKSKYLGSIEKEDIKTQLAKVMKARRELRMNAVDLELV